MEITIAPIPPEHFEDYRYKVISGAYKWDPQCGDSDTVSRHACLLPEETASQLEKWAEELTAELFLMERKLLGDLSLGKDMRLDKSIIRTIRDSDGYDPQKHVRLMRYDFHPTAEGWALSEVNSDVPCGFAESVLLAGIAKKFFDGYAVRKNIAQIIFDSFKPKLAVNRIAFVHATAYSEDRQVMQFLRDFFWERGVDGVFAAPDHIRWEGKRAFCLLDNGEIGGIIRSFPAEWLTLLPKKCWRGYFSAGIPQCNHPAALLTQSKRLPLIWDKLGLELPVWRKLLPETRDPRSIPPISVKKRGCPKTGRPQGPPLQFAAETRHIAGAGLAPAPCGDRMANDDHPADEWIYKAAMDRVGRGVAIRGAVKEKELKAINRAVRRHPKNWVAQRMFKSLPLGEDRLHLCLGVFTVNGKAAGFYGRVGSYNLIDAYAADIPVLVGENRL